ncbi:MAG TPA: hypothetical protein VFW96_13310 [Thermomicrobiales bacterium]|nr:hypothetical protein [Thermomicrobiales bacterium]
MTTTIYLSVRGDGAWRVLEFFRHALGEDAGTLVVQSNRDESGFYGSADVRDVEAARAAFTTARQPYPGLKAHLSAPAPEREEPPRRTGGPPAARPPRPEQRAARERGAAPAPKPSPEQRSRDGRPRGPRRRRKPPQS